MKSHTGAGPDIPRELEALRASLDARLTALEAALADPDQHGSLEQIILDLARVATEEADAAARHACLAAQQEGQRALAVADAERQIALDTEGAAAGLLRTELEQAQAELRDERASRAAKDRDLGAVRQALEQEQTSRAGLSRQLDEARAALEAERVAVATLQQQVERAHAAHQSERTAGATRDRDFAAVQQALERELQQEQAEHASVRRALEEGRTATATLQQALEQAQAALQSEQSAHAKLRKELTAARGASEADRAKVHVDLEQASEDVEARAQTAIRERQALVVEFDAVKQAAAAAAADAHARYEKLRDATEQKIRSLQLAVSEADERATAAERDVELQRRVAKPRDTSAKPARAHAASPVAAAPTEGKPKPAGPVRGATRVAMSGDFDIQIDGHPCKLIDLSTTGAQILSPGALKPNRLVTVNLPLGDTRVSCKGKIMWSRLEPGRAGGQHWYRAGVSFTSADEASIEAFLRRQTQRE